MLSPPFENVTEATAAKARLFLLSCEAWFGWDSFFILNATIFLMPIAIGTMPNSPIIYNGTASEKKKPNALMATSKPIPLTVSISDITFH